MTLDDLRLDVQRMVLGPDLQKRTVKLDIMYLIPFFNFLKDRVSLCGPNWSAVTRSQLTAASTAWGQALYLAVPAESQGKVKSQLCLSLKCVGPLSLHSWFCGPRGTLLSATRWSPQRSRLRVGRSSDSRNVCRVGQACLSVIWSPLCC